MRASITGLLLIFLTLSQATAQRLVDPVKVDAKTETVINGALKYLADHQTPSGAWFGIDNREKQYPIAMTAYTLMAFLAAGHLPGEGEYGGNVAKGTKYLVDSVDEEGLIGDKNSGQYMYFQSFRTNA